MKENNMEDNNLRAVVEAVLYASGAPVELSRLEGVLNVPKKELLAVLDEIKEEYEDERHGFELVRTGDNFRFVTKLSLGQTVASYLATRKTNLSNAAMETLAIAAYNQPVTKTYISQIRGVSSGEVVEALVEKGLLAEDGKTDLPGRPMSYVTTDRFLTVFGLSDISELPEADFLTDELADLAMPHEKQLLLSGQTEEEGYKSGQIGNEKLND